MGQNIGICLRNSSINEPLRLEGISEQALAKSYESSLEPTVSNSSSISQPTSTVDVHTVIDQVFVLCERGLLVTLQFIIDSHSDCIYHLNDKRSCSIQDISLDLTPLQLSAACGHSDIVSYLLSFASINIEECDSLFGMTALHLASYLGHTMIVEVLVKDLRIDTAARTLDGKTALHIAIAQQHSQVVECFLRMKPKLDIHVRDFDGNTILHSASIYPQDRIMKLIIQYIVTQCATNDSHYSPNTSIARKRALCRVKSIFELTNNQGDTAEAILRKTIIVMETAMQKYSNGSTYSNSPLSFPSPGSRSDGHQEPSTPDESKYRDARHPEDCFWSSESYQEDVQRLDLALDCLQILLDHTSTIPSAESMSSFGCHSSADQSETLDLGTDHPTACSYSPMKEITNFSLKPLDIYID